MLQIDLLASGAVGFILGWFVIPRLIVWVKSERGVKRPRDKKK